MDRRAFIHLAGLTGVALFAPWGFGSKDASAAESTWGGPYFLHMHASGGWDPTLLCDAKLTAAGTAPVYENRIVTGVREINGIFVPTTTTANAPFLLRENGNGGALEDPQQFFDTVGRDVLVLNGVDTQTNNHDTGTQAVACGHNDIELPALAALFAGSVSKQRDIPMAFLADGAYNRTGDVVGISRFPGDKVELLVNPYSSGTNENDKFISDVAVRRIQELRAKRYAQIEPKVTLPRNKRTFNAMRDANRGGASVNLLKSVAEAQSPAHAEFAAGLSPATADFLAEDVNGRSRFVDLGRPMETILKCFQAGVTASATYAEGGFDTHSNHDTDQAESLGRFIARLRYVLLRSAQLGLKDKLYVMVTSDFGRTPRYNTGNGKDHWNVTSVLMVGPGIRGGRAIGKTDEGHKVLRVRPDNVSQTLPDSDLSGSRIHPAHIHRELRRVLNVEALAAPFPLPSAAPSYNPLPLLA
jgi:hypothetical protein